MDRVPGGTVPEEVRYNSPVAPDRSALVTGPMAAEPRVTPLAFAKVAVRTALKAMGALLASAAWLRVFVALLGQSVHRAQT